MQEESIYDILKSLNMEKNTFTQAEWIELLEELEEHFTEQEKVISESHIQQSESEE